MTKTKGLRLLRTEIEKHKQITAAQAAKDLGVNKSSVSMWIQGKYLPSADKRELIEAWSQGRVPCSAWRTAKAQGAIAAASTSRHGSVAP